MNAPVVTQAMRRMIPAGFLEALKEKFGSRFSTAPAVCEHHGKDESPYPPMLPDGVVFALDTEDVAWVAQHFHRPKVPLTPFGPGPTLAGHLMAITGGSSAALSGRNVGGASGGKRWFQDV